MPHVLAVRALRGILIASAVISIGLFDTQIGISTPTCQNWQDLSPSVFTYQPDIVNLRLTSTETVYWYPILERWTGTEWTRELIDRVAFPPGINALPFGLPYKFENLAGGYYYRINHYVYWGSNGQQRSKPSEYCWLPPTWTQ